MAFRVWRDDDIDPGLIRAERVAILGYGNQGRAQALNLRDAGVEVVVGARAGGAAEAAARGDGFAPVSIREASEAGSVVMMLLPDEVQPDLYKAEVLPHLQAGNALAFSHGFSIHFGQVTAPEAVDVILVAPKGPGRALRAAYERGEGLAGVVAAHEDHEGRAFDLALSYAGAIGCGRVGVMATTFAEETVGDLFGEQAVLCGGLVELVREAWSILVTEGGVAPHLAYYDVVKEVKLIADLLHDQGIAAMAHAISDTAEFGSYRTGPRVISEAAREGMRAALRDITSGVFAADWLAEARTGRAVFHARRAAAAGHPIEDAGAALAAALRPRPAPCRDTAREIARERLSAGSDGR